MKSQNPYGDFQFTEERRFLPLKENGLTLEKKFNNSTTKKYHTKNCLDFQRKQISDHIFFFTKYQPLAKIEH